MVYILLIGTGGAKSWIVGRTTEDKRYADETLVCLRLDCGLILDGDQFDVGMTFRICTYSSGKGGTHVNIVMLTSSRSNFRTRSIEEQIECHVGSAFRCT
jgi:hypothetical protein